MFFLSFLFHRDGNFEILCTEHLGGAGGNVTSFTIPHVDYHNAAAYKQTQLMTGYTVTEPGNNQMAPGLLLLLWFLFLLFFDCFCFGWFVFVFVFDFFFFFLGFITLMHPNSKDVALPPNMFIAGLLLF